MSKAQEILELIDEFGDERYWVGRHAAHEDTVGQNTEDYRKKEAAMERAAAVKVRIRELVGGVR